MRATSVLPALLLCQILPAEQSFRKIDLYSGGGLLPQIVDSAEWKTTIYLHNMEAAAVNAIVYFVDDRGLPLGLPFGGKSAPFRALTLQTHETAIVESDGVGAIKQGYAAVFTCDRNCADLTSKAIDAKLAVFAVFRQRVQGRADSEAVMPLEMPEKSVSLVFDNRGGYAMGVALLNFLGGPISVAIMDEAGRSLETGTLNVAEDEKVVFVLADKYPVTAGKYGCIQFSGTGLAAMGLRFSPNGSFTSSHALTMH